MRLRIDVLKRKELDARFAEMSEDTYYQKEATLLAEEFESSDWEAAHRPGSDRQGGRYFNHGLCRIAARASVAAASGLWRPVLRWV